MAKLPITIQTTTIGGFNATLTDLYKRRPTDQLEGYVFTPQDGKKYVRWDYYGFCRDNLRELNLSMSKPELEFVRFLKLR